MRVHAKTFASLSLSQVFLLMVLMSMTLTTACATFGSTHPKPPVPVSEVIQMSKDGVLAETIIERCANRELYIGSQDLSWHSYTIKA